MNRLLTSLMSLALVFAGLILADSMFLLGVVLEGGRR